MIKKSYSSIYITITLIRRFDAQTGADREVQRILIELLNQMDGFDQTTNVKIIMATNRPDTLDPALLRPGRLDRKVEFPYPDRRQKRLILQTITSKMNLAPECDLETCKERILIKEKEISRFSLKAAYFFKLQWCFGRRALIERIWNI